MNSAINIPLYNADVNMDTPPIAVLDNFPDWLEILQERNQLDFILRATTRNCLDAHGYQCDTRTDCPSYPEHCPGWLNR